MDNLRVLVCDDEPGMRMGVARALRNFTVDVSDILSEGGGEVGFTVDQAESGEEALKLIEAASPDILLLDHKLPGISGLDVLDQIASKPTDMLTIMITAYASIETAVRATKQGAYDFLPKPFTPAELKNAVRKAADHVVVTAQARKLALEKHQVRFQFISVLAHELKAPLGAIEGYLHVLQDKTAGDDPATYDHVIDRCLTRASYMRKMILDLLDLTRIESGQKKRELALVDVIDAAQTAMESAKLDADPRGIAMTLEAQAPIQMYGDRGEIEIVLNNLVSNAVKYNRDNGTVTVKLEAADDAVTMAVSDTGIGMSEEECARLFGDFVRIKNVKTRGILGSGLGLSIVKKIARLYEGSVAVDSHADEGTTFTVVLKNRPPSEGETASTAE